MQIRRSCRALVLSCAVLLFPRPGEAQGVVVIPRPRALTEARTREVQTLSEQRSLRGEEQTDALVREVDVPETGRWLRTWSLFRDEDEAARFWATDTVAVLPASALSPGSDRAAIYTELASALSGGWRFALGTTLAVSTEGSTEPEAGAAQEGDTEPDTDAGFQKFVAGGGNLSLTGARPLALMNANYSSHLVFVVPRVWANIPSLGDADDVTDFGGELAAEYHYQRYARQMRADGNLEPMPESPFLTLQVRGGVVHGTNDFYRTIGRADERLFVYVAPTVHLVFDGKVKLGVTYFFGPADFRRHQNLRINLALAPPRKPEAQRAPAPVPQR